MKKTVVALLLFMGAAFPYVVGYHVEPVKALWSGWTPSQFPNNYVAQTVTCNFDSLSYVELFAGAKGDTGAYTATVYEGNTRLTGSAGNWVPDHNWVRFDQWTDTVAFTKGKQLTIKFTRSGSDSIQYYYQDGDPYKNPYGLMILPWQNPPIPLTWDLAMRCYGRMNAVDSTIWGATSIIPFWQYDSLRGIWSDSMRSSGAHWGTFQAWWSGIQPRRDSMFWGDFDAHVRYIAESAGMEPVAVLLSTPRWASTRVDSTKDDTTPGVPGDSFWRVDTSMWAAPRGMLRDTNFWVEYLDALLDHVDLFDTASRIHAWSIWNEENEGATTWVHGDSWPGYTGPWRRPNRYYDVTSSVHDMCSLYVRLCALAARTIRSHAGHDGDRIIIGELARVNFADPSIQLVPGKEWLRAFYDIADRDTTYPTGRFWSAVSVHPYQTGWSLFCPDSFATNAETLRALMRDSGDTAQLWNSEFDCGTRTTVTASQNANSLCEAFTSVPAQAALPGGTFDRICWWQSWQPFGWASWALFDSFMEPNPGFFAFKQVTRTLNGKRFNGRVSLGSVDDYARVYEFEGATGKRTWVGFATDTVPYDNPVNVRIAARCDEPETCALAYDDNEQPDTKPTQDDGWLSMSLTPRPVYVTEPEGESLCRPEMVVDSVRLGLPHPQVGLSMDVTAWIRNCDSPGSDTTPQGVPTVVHFCWNDSVFGSDSTTSPIAPGATFALVCHLESVPDWMHGAGLLTANANPGMRFVEGTGTDDNAGYLRLFIPQYPTGTVDAVVPPGGMTNVPVVVFKLSSMSLEKDSTGNTPCDSARLIQTFFGISDTAVQDADTTDWFAFVPDTSWRFMFGQGRYRFFLEVRDSWSTSEPIADSVDSVVVFDTSAAVGSFVINDGARFARDTACTLDIAVADSVSGAYRMRFGTHRLANVVLNSGFDADDGTWEYSAGQLDNDLKMVELPVTSSTQASVIQFILPESLIAYAGDSCRLQADLAVHVHDPQEQVIGQVFFRYWYTKTDTTQNEVHWDTLAEIAFTDSIQSRTGLANLDAQFLLPGPVLPDTSWVWRGGVVGIEVSGLGAGEGKVWADNVKVEPCAPPPAFSWWQAYDTTGAGAWGLEPGDGEKTVFASFQDSAGVENPAPMADSIILDMTYPCPYIRQPQSGAYINDTVDITGWAYDPITCGTDTFFESYRLSYRHVDSTNWQPVSPDSVSFAPVYPDSSLVFGAAQHLGYWDTESLLDGEYWLRLNVRDSAGNELGHLVWVVVANDGTGDDGAGGPPGGGSGMGGGSVYIGSTTGKVLHLSEDLDSLDAWTVTDSGSPAYVTAILEVGNDSLLVLDARNKRIHKLHKGGQNRRRLVSNLSIPCGITRDDNGNLWLVDKGIHRIGKFRSNGTLVFTRGGLGADSLHFNSPEAIAVNGSLVYVADTKNDRIAVWDTIGNYQGSIVGGFTSPTAVAVTDSGLILLADENAKRIKAINQRGGHILTLKAQDGTRLEHLVASENEHSIFTLKPSGNRVLRFRIRSDDSLPGGVQSQGNLNLPKLLTLAQPFPNPARTRLSIHYALPRQTRVVLKLYDIAGKLVNTLASADQKPGYYNLVWNRQDAKGRTCACGVYFCTLAAEGQRFSRKVVLTE